MLNLQTLTLNKNATIRDALQVIDNAGLKIAIILDERQKFFGVLSDGDVRRGLINGLHLHDKIDNIVNQDCVYADENTNSQELQKLFKINDIDQIPIIDKQKNFVGLKTSDKLYENQEFVLFISAGGEGLRLRPLTNHIPKPLVEVNGNPIIKHIINRFKGLNIKRIYISINYLGKKIIEFFKGFDSHNFEIIFLQEKQKLGTIGAMSLIKEKINVPILAMNSDIISNFSINDLINDHKKSKADMTVGVRNFEVEIPFGIFGLNKKGFVKSVKEKPTYSFASNSGIYVLSPSLLNTFKKNIKLDATDMIENLLLNNNKVNSFFIHEYWKDIGTHDQLKAVEADLKRIDWS